jgi:hypothetical protein
VAGKLRIRPVELEDSKEVRLKRLIPTAEWKPATAALLIPESVVPKDDVIAWVTDLLQQLTSPA